MIFDFTVNLFEEKSYLFGSESGRCVLIDPGFRSDSEFELLYSTLKDKKLKLEAILLTHSHPDHIFAVAELSERFEIPVYMHPREKQVLLHSKDLWGRYNLPIANCNFTTIDIEDGQILKFADTDFKVIATPGHSPGSVCYLIENEGILFSGDTLFAGTIGRSDLMFGDYDDEIRSIMEKLILLPAETIIYPGHGPSSTIAHERSHNPFLEPFNEAETPFDPNAEPIIIHS